MNIIKPNSHGRPRLVPFLPSLQHSEEITQNVFMFVEDISRPMPLGSGRKKQFSAILTGDEIEQKKARQLLDSLSEHSGRSVEEKVSNAVDTLARRIVWEGRAQFELIARDDGTIHFHAVTTKKLFKLCTFSFQYLNAEDREFWKSPAVRWAPRSALWHVDVPKELGNRRGHRRLLSALRNFNNLGPQFWNQDMQNGRNPSCFDLNTYVLSNSIFRSKVTHSWGWDCRDWSTERTTEFYNMYRSAASEKAKSIFRSHILSQINALLKRMCINCSIAIEGLHSPADVEKVIHDLITGELSFKDFRDFKSRR